MSLPFSLCERVFGGETLLEKEEERLLAPALDISRADLRPMSFAGCSFLDDLDQDAILARDYDA